MNIIIHIMKKYETPIPDTTLASTSLSLNIATAIRELNYHVFV